MTLPRAETWESLIRDFVRHLKGTNRAVNTQTIYRRAAEGLVRFLEADGELPAPAHVTRRHVEAYMAHLIDTRSAATASVVHRALQQLMRWLLDEEEIDPHRWSGCARPSCRRSRCRWSPRRSCAHCWPRRRAPRSLTAATRPSSGCCWTPAGGCRGRRARRRRPRLHRGRRSRDRQGAASVRPALRAAGRARAGPPSA